MENMFDLLEQHPSIADAPGAMPLAPAGYSITFDNVGFQVS
jgi:ABC-type transport system involved in Fe-S cluster assembly fused permease/ATPase subunit